MGNLFSLLSKVPSWGALFAPRHSLLHAPNRLPYDTQRDVLSHISDRSTLLSCTLVCKRWLVDARLLLYNPLKISMEDTRLLVSRLVRLPSHIKRLRLVEYTTTRTCIMNGEQEREIDYATQPVVVGQLLSYLSQPRKRRRCIWEKLTIVFSHITHLELSSIEFYTSSDAIKFIRSFPQLQTISIEHLSWKDAGAADMDRSLPKGIQITLLSVNDKNATKISDWLLPQCSSVSIKKLHFETHSLVHNRAVCALVKAAGHTLQELRFSMTFERLPPIPENLNESVEVSYCLELTHLHLDNINLTAMYRYAPLWIPHVLSQIKSKVLRKLTLGLMMHRFPDLVHSSIPWESMDTIIEENEEEVSRFIRSKLPRAAGQYSLEITFDRDSG